MGTGDMMHDSELQRKERKKRYEIRTFPPGSVSSQLFPLLNSKLQKKAGGVQMILVWSPRG